MEKQRTLAYKLATVVELDELDNVSGGNQQIRINIPTLKLTGGPIVPDFSDDHEHNIS